MKKAELIKLIDSRIALYFINNPPVQQAPQYVYGLAGLSSLLNISRYTAMKLINSGTIPVQGTPKKMMFPVEEVLKIMNRNPANEILEAVKKGGANGK